jgi:hypothetical protein
VVQIFLSSLPYFQTKRAEKRVVRIRRAVPRGGFFFVFIGGNEGEKDEGRMMNDENDAD